MTQITTVAGDLLVPDILAWHLLGEGPHCSTWAGWSVSKWCPVVVKLPSDDSDLERATASLQREQSFLTRLHHPGVVRVLGACLEGPRPYLITEAVEGHTLSTALAKRPMRPRNVVRLALQLLSIIQYLHRERVVHLDLKPDNVMVRNGRAVVLDFGAAQDIGASMSRGPRGTDGYMAPEQRAAEPASVAMDLYSLGVILYEALTGRDSDGPPVWRGRARWAPRELRQLITEMMDLSPSHRPASAVDALAVLTQLETTDGAGWAPSFAWRHMTPTRPRTDTLFAALEAEPLDRRLKPRRR